MEEYFNIRNALKNSSKLKHWDKPPRDYGPNNPEDSDYNRNGLKEVGDLSKVDFSRQFSFTSEPETKEEECEEESKDEEPTDPQPSFYSMAETSESEHHSIPTSLDIARKAYEQYKLNLLLEKMSLDKEYKEKIQRKTQQKQEEYLQFLKEIHSRHEEEMKSEHLIQKEKLKHEENLLRKREEEAQLAVQHLKKEYTNQVSRYSSQLLEAIESAQRQEAEQANIVQSLLTQLQAASGDYVGKLDVMYQLVNDLEGTEMINRNTEVHLTHVRSQVEGIISSSSQRLPTRLQIEETHKSLQQGLSLVDSIIQKLEARKLEKTNLEAERIHQENEKAKAEALELERQEAELREQERIENEKKNEAPPASNKDRLLELKQKVNHYLEAPEQLSKDQQWEVRRKATMANQLNKDSHSINREKLQKLLSEMRERKGEPIILASFKNSVMSNIVKQVAIQDSLGASAYSWLLVELVTFHPDLWDLFLYYIFKACPNLMPGSQMSDETEKTIEKSDVYYSQIGKYSAMYGFVLARISKKQGSAIKAAAVGWGLMANIVSQPPLSGVTGELLLKFIQSFGFTLQETYRRQFIKMMEFIVKCYVPRIKEATEEGGQNCLTLLENFIAEYRPNKLTRNPMIMKYM